jgi:RNA polymerase sigma factor (sigma-70 family)
LVSYSNTSKTICLWNWSSPTGKIAEPRSQFKSLHCETAPQVNDEADFDWFYGIFAEKHGSKVMTAELGDGFNLEWKASPYTTKPFEIKGPMSGDVRVISKSMPEVREYGIDMESGITCLQLFWNGTQLTCGAEYTDGEGYREPSMRILDAVPSLRRSKGVVPRMQDEVVAIRMLSYEKHVHFHCGNFEPFDARWEGDTAYRLRSINKDGAIGLESFSGKWVWLNVYSGNRLLDAGELANLQVPMKRFWENYMPGLESVDAVEQRAHIKAVLNTLTESEREVMEQRFALKDGYTRTLEEVGRQLQITRERILRIEAKALRKMRHPTRIRKLEGFIKLPEDPKPSRSELEKSSTASESGSAPEGGLEDLLKEFRDDKNAEE